MTRVAPWSNVVSPWLLSCLVTVSVVFPCFGMELAPRQWGHLPVGTNFAGIAYLHTEADIFIDPALLLEDVEMKLDTWAGKYIRTFELFDKSARVDVTQAYQEGKWEGLLDGTATKTSRSGWSDTVVRLAVNLLGAPPLRGKEFAAYRTGKTIETNVGMALAVHLPTGEYLDDKLINLGNNRYTFRPQIGVFHRRGRWTAEATGEVAVFTENDDFFNGNKLEKDPTYIIYGNLIYTFRPGLWLGASFGYDYGGANSVNGVDKNDTRQNIGWALNFAYPINRSAGIGLTYVGTRTEESVGFDSDTFGVSASLAW